MTTITMKHIRAAGYCSSGARRWFAQKNLPWSDFVTNGIPAETLDALDDHLANQVTAIAREEERRGKQ